MGYLCLWGLPSSGLLAQHLQQMAKNEDVLKNAEDWHLMETPRAFQTEADPSEQWMYWPMFLNDTALDSKSKHFEFVKAWTCVSSLACIVPASTKRACTDGD